MGGWWFNSVVRLRLSQPSFAGVGAGWLRLTLAISIDSPKKIMSHPSTSIPSPGNAKLFKSQNILKDDAPSNKHTLAQTHDFLFQKSSKRIRGGIIIKKFKNLGHCP